MNLAHRIAWVDRLPASLWIALPMVALIPVWLWTAARLQDGADDPLGIVALAALVILLVRDRASFTHSPRAGWLLAAAALAAAAVVGASVLPPLARGVLAVLAVCASLMAVRAAVQPMLALTGLALLALPLLSSLQFYAGYPLRVVTAEASRWLLLPFGIEAMRAGSALEIAGRLVMVDAPCAGIQMGWVAYFTACAAAAWRCLPDRSFLRRVPLVGATVLAGNIVRNTLLVVKEAELLAWPAWTHDAAGLAIFAAVCAFVLRHIARAGGTCIVTWEVRLLNRPAPSVSPDTWARLFALAALCGVALWPWLHPAPLAAHAAPAAVEWPHEFEGRPLQPLALSAVEQRFAERFPGAIARFTDGSRTIVLRHVTAPTRMLHPATDCYRGLGYRVLAAGLEQQAGAADAGPRLWRCFVAEKNGRRMRVCERIVDARGRGYTDTSAWYWAAVTGRSQGPWRAVTKAGAM